VRRPRRPGEAAPDFREEEGGRRGESGSGRGCWSGRRWKEIRPAAAPALSISPWSRPPAARAIMNQRSRLS
jgi:hypothetical protein